VFNRLSQLHGGDEVELTLSDGSQLRYRVTSVVDYNLAAIDMGALLQGREGVESLVLMTCSGQPAAHGFDERTVVLAERITP
jgi:LPXTG-site transpeptidase (sortase) family protein